MKFTVHTEQQMAELARKFSKAIILPLIVGVSGHLGVGKTVYCACGLIQGKKG